MLLISTYVLEFLMFYPGNIADEVHYYRDSSEISVTNPTIYKEDLKHYYQTLKTLDENEFDDLNKSIFQIEKVS